MRTSMVRLFNRGAKFSGALSSWSDLVDFYVYVCPLKVTTTGRDSRLNNGFV